MSVLKRLENDSSMYVFECPHCSLLIEVPVNQLNCRIFRHGGTSTFKPIKPHAVKGRYVAMAPDYTRREWPPVPGQIYGCGQPFRIVNHTGSLTAVPCGWI